MLLNQPMANLIRANGLGPFYCQGWEILRQLFVTVRDRDWHEISPTDWICQLDEARRVITVEARHSSELVDFEWQGRLEVSEDGYSMRFAFEGEAQRTMDLCRLGLIVLHPLETMLGARLTTLGPDGEETYVVSPTIAPQPIIQGIPAAIMQPFASLTVERADLGLLEFEFDGDLFELEDQRNWGDASFKTYCTPLRLGFPRQVNKGTRIAQGLHLRITPASAAPMIHLKPAPSGNYTGVFPTLGRDGWGAAVSGAQALNWHHAHVDLSYLKGIEGGTFALEEHQARLQIGVEGQELDEPVPDQVSWIARHRAHISRILLYGVRSSCPSPASVLSWRRALDAAGATGLPLFAATHGYFVEFNRSLGAATAKGVGLAFPLTATVHADDPITLAQNVATIEDIVRTARRSMQPSAITIAPLALYYPALPNKTRDFPRPLLEPWLAATLFHAALAGVDSVTLAQDVTSIASASFLGPLLGFAGFEVTSLPEGQPSGIEVVVLNRPAQREAHLVALNLQNSPSALNVRPLAAHVWSLDGVRIGQSGQEPHVDIRAFEVQWFTCELN